jgi:hypothetical protein
MHIRTKEGWRRRQCDTAGSGHSRQWARPALGTAGTGHGRHGMGAPCGGYGGVAVVRAAWLGTEMLPSAVARDAPVPTACRRGENARRPPALQRLARSCPRKQQEIGGGRRAAQVMLRWNPPAALGGAAARAPPTFGAIGCARACTACAPLPVSPCSVRTLTPPTPIHHVQVQGSGGTRTCFAMCSCTNQCSRSSSSLRRCVPAVLGSDRPAKVGASAAIARVPLGAASGCGCGAASSLPLPMIRLTVRSSSVASIDSRTLTNWSTCV